MKILNEELDIDFLDADTAERYDKATQNYNKAHAEFAKQKNSYSETVKGCCYIVFDYINDLFGDGTAERIFGENCNLRQAFDAMNSIRKEFERQTKETLDELKKISDDLDSKQPKPQNRQQRREIQKQKNNRRFQLIGDANESSDKETT